MLIYEVNLTVDEDIATEYSTWLREHIREMLTIDGFEAAAWYWHFVDVVWLFLFSAVYWWGA